MSPTHTWKSGKLYRYYISQTAMKRGGSDCSVRLVPAAEIERIVLDQIRKLLQTPEVIVQTWRAARKQNQDITETEVRTALVEFDSSGTSSSRRSRHESLSCWSSVSISSQTAWISL